MWRCTEASLRLKSFGEKKSLSICPPSLPSNSSSHCSCAPTLPLLHCITVTLNIIVVINLHQTKATAPLPISHVGAGSRKNLWSLCCTQSPRQSMECRTIFLVWLLDFIPILHIGVNPVGKLLIPQSLQMSVLKLGMWLQAKKKKKSLLYGVLINPDPKMLLGSSILNLELQIWTTSVINVLQLHVKTVSSREWAAAGCRNSVAAAAKRWCKEKLCWMWQQLLAARSPGPAPI